ncbi:MAG TPA: hypothetical protein VKJ65_07925 [Phycisphaerae bacterium]|nr:hypothetical protein [Phycisphaerae bacterium]
MSITPDAALDSLTRIVQVVRDDQKLRRWFHALIRKSAVDRRNEIYFMSQRLAIQNGDADLVASFSLLADPRIFDAARLALSERELIK